MVSVKKHIAPIFLISILCFPALLFLYLQARQKIVQHEMVEKLEHAELETITLHNSAVQWYKKNKEIVVDATLFDVHRYRVIKDSTVFTGLFDTRETELKNQVKKLLERRNESNSSREVVIAKLVLQLWIGQNINSDITILNETILNTKHIDPSGNLLSGDVSIPLPPPRA